jgi:RNA polymerase sigma-32 factor
MATSRRFRHSTADHLESSALSHYIALARSTPVLDREQELELATKWKLTGDQSAANTIVRAHLRHVLAIALEFRRYGVSISDLVAEGNFGLAHALRKFDPQRNTRFATYASYWIRAYVLNHVLHSWSLVTSGRPALRSKLFFKLRRERARLTGAMGDGARMEEAVAAGLNLAPERVADMFRQLDARDVSFDFMSEVGAPVSWLAATEPSQEWKLVQTERSRQVQDVVRAALRCLDAREQYIVELCTMADRGGRLSLSEVARRMGVSRERVRQLEERAKRKLRAAVPEICRERGYEWDGTWASAA